MITRTIKTWEAKAVALGLDAAGEPVADVLGIVQFQGNKGSRTEARAAFAAQGIMLPKGINISIVCVSEDTYGCEIDEFMSVARKLD